MNMVQAAFIHKGGFFNGCFIIKHYISIFLYKEQKRVINFFNFNAEYKKKIKKNWIFRILLSIKLTTACHYI